MAGVAFLVSAAGCLGRPGDPDSDDADTTSTSVASNETSSGTDTTDSDTTDDPLSAVDAREANVIEVAFESIGTSTYRFDVTLFHDDEGESGYADWWQVETLAGEKLGRRTLLHAHGTRPFTRSAEIEIPSGTSCVVVRGHDQTHGYGGRAIVVKVESGDSSAIDQGEERSMLDASVCP